MGRQVLEETVEGVRRGFCELLSQPKLPAPLLAAASDLRKQISGVYRTMREGVQRHATGRAPPWDPSYPCLESHDGVTGNAGWCIDCGSVIAPPSP